MFLKSVKIFICENCYHWFFPNYPSNYCNFCNSKLKILYAVKTIKLEDSNENELQLR